MWHDRTSPSSTGPRHPPNDQKRARIVDFARASWASAFPMMGQQRPATLGQGKNGTSTAAPTDAYPVGQAP